MLRANAMETFPDSLSGSNPSQSYGAKPPVLHHSSCHSLTTNQPPSESCPLRESRKLSRHWLQDPRNSHSSVLIVPPLGIPKSWTPKFGFEPWLQFICPGPLPSPGWLSYPHPLWTAWLVGGSGPCHHPSNPGWEGQQCLPLLGLCHQEERTDKHLAHASFMFSLLHYKAPEDGLRFFFIFVSPM